MNFADTFHKSIDQAFTEYHKANPEIYEHFKRLAFRAINNGKSKISFKLIMNVIRWEVYIKTVDLVLFDTIQGAKTFKLNDAYGSRYARMFVNDFPEHADKVELRRLRS